MKEDPVLDYTRYFWQGGVVRLRPLRSEDARGSFIGSLDSPTRQVLQLGIELPSSEKLQADLLEKYLGCKDANGVIVFAIDALHGR